MAGFASWHFCSKQASNCALKHIVRQPTGFRLASACLIKGYRYGSGRHYSSAQSEFTISSSAENRNLVEQAEQLYRERFIPLTRRTTVACLLKDGQKLTVSERKGFENFALQLDAIITNKYASTLEELKQLFDPISPDKDTMTTRLLSSKDKRDNEFWLLQRLSQVMEKANFYELTDAEIRSKMTEREHHEGVKVSVNVDNYSILKFWVLGKEIAPVKHSIFTRFTKLVLRKPFSQTESKYKRVIAAVRVKNEEKLTLKAFKDIAVNDLEKVLPLGAIKIGKFDRYVVMTSITLTSLALLSKLVTVLAKLSVSWPLLFAGFTSLLGVRGYWAYRSRKNSYLSALNKTLYYKNIANNRGLITLVIDRAQDETFKETLLTYTFIQSLSRGDNAHSLSHDTLSAEVTGVALENAIEQWVFDQTGAAIEFDSTESIAILEKVGILSVKRSGVAETLSVLPLEQAHRLLPQTPLSILTRVDESDVTEGYDRSKYEEPVVAKNRSSFMKFFKVFK